MTEKQNHWIKKAKGLRAEHLNSHQNGYQNWISAIIITKVVYQKMSMNQELTELNNRHEPKELCGWLQ